jgi:hypothetical protein
MDEPDETFTVNLSGATNAVLGDPAGTVTILDDDEPQPPIRITDASTPEGGEATMAATLTVSLDFASASYVSVYWATEPGTASATDFVGGSGVITFEPGDTSEQLTIPVVDDYYDEANETFTVRLSNATGGVVADADGVVTIVDDDTTIG